VTLGDDLVERYSRQILLPEVGGRGQEQLCATRAAVAGSDGAAAFAATLLAAAGVQVECRTGEAGTISVTVPGRGVVLARIGRSTGIVVTLVGHPCTRCVPAAVWPGDAASGPAGERAEPAQAVGALVAAEGLRVALGLAASGRVQTLDLGRGTFGGRHVPAGDGCDACPRRG